MRIVFLNTFEQRGSELLRSAQLSIGEQDGTWHVQWLELGEPEAVPESWYAGVFWDEMLAALRHGAASRMADGYMPVIKGQLEDAARPSAGKTNDMLQYYAEQHSDEKLYGELRDWRRKRAVSDRKSAYLIANNRMLRLISCFVPHTEEEMLQLPGWGRGKQTAYGEEILAITRETERQLSFPLDWVERQIDYSELERWLFKQKEQKYKSELIKQQQKRMILEIIHAGGKMNELEQQLSLSRREIVVRLEQIEEEGYSVEPLIEQELHAMPKEEQESIIEAIASVGDRYLKPVLQQVYGGKESELDQTNKEKIYEAIRFLRLRYRRSGTISKIS